MRFQFTPKLRPIRIPDEDKLYYDAVAVMFFVMLVVLFNVFFAPLLMLLLFLYIIHRGNRMLSVAEQLIIFVFMIPAVLYILIARVYGLTVGFSVAIPVCLVSLLVLLYKKRGGVL